MSETTAIATVQRHPARAVALRETMVQDAEQRAVLGEYIKAQMVEGEDYGVLPGTNNDRSKGAVRKVLFKPGAEKLIGLFRCVPKFHVDGSVEQWDTGLFHYRIRCDIVLQDDEAIVVASGLGSCSTYESKYRWRNADRTCPNCGAAAILRSKYPPKDYPDDEPGWYCFSKKGGCGANFEHADDRITGQTTGRVQNPDILDTVNTVLKMAKKRAAVDAALSLSRCSDIFTQDVGDDDHEERRPEPARQQQKPASPPPPPPKPDPAAVAQRVNEFIDGLAAVAATGDLDRIAELAADANGDAVLKGAPSASRERLRLAFAEARETAAQVAARPPEQPAESIPDADYTPAG